MSLFKDITDELEQAVNAIENNQAEEEDLFAFFSDTVDTEADQELLDIMLEEKTDAPEETVEEFITAEECAEQLIDESPVAETTVTEEPRREISEAEKNAVTVITKGTIITGGISSDCSLDVMGTIKGDIECLGRLTIFGKVVGNSLASEVVVNTDRLEGSIVSKGSVKVGLGTVVIGDVMASSAVFSGAVKGNIDVKGPVVLESTAIIKGNIQAKSIQIANGAVIDGFCSLSYADLKIDSIFE